MSLEKSKFSSEKFCIKKTRTFTIIAMNFVQEQFKKKTGNQGQNAACEQKTTSEKAKFCSNTVFSLYFKIRAKKFHAAKPLAFSLHFLLHRDQNHYSNLTSKIMNV